MTFNWQKPDWPHFSWDHARLTQDEARFLLEMGTFVGVTKHLNSEEQLKFRIESLSLEALTTSQIEGEMLDRISVQSSIRRQFGLAVDPRTKGKAKVRKAEQGIAEMTVDLHRGFAQPLSEDMLFNWHRMIMQGRTDLQAIGQYRTGSEPMQVVSGSIHMPKVHFEAPPSKAMPREMKRFIAWFNRTAPTGKSPLPTLTRAGIAHLYFVSIHPFEDGNGRLARALTEKALSQGLGQPTLIALAATILKKHKSYYDSLETANKRNEITKWLGWSATTVMEAQRRTMAGLEFLLAKTRLLDRLRGQLNPRQEKALHRMLREGQEGFEGGLSANNYMTITGASPATATRDLAGLVDHQALTRQGDRRYARYCLAILQS